MTFIWLYVAAKIVSEFFFWKGKRGKTRILYLLSVKKTKNPKKKREREGKRQIQHIENQNYYYPLSRERDCLFLHYITIGLCAVYERENPFFYLFIICPSTGRIG